MIKNKTVIMKVKIKDNVIYESFDNKNDMMGKILQMILESHTDKILYKGDPKEINYKLMKKVILEKYTEKIDPILVKNMYEQVIQNDEQRDFCIIYKEK